MTSGSPPGGQWTEGSWGWHASDRQPPDDGLLRRLRQAVVVLSILLIALVVFAWQHGGNSLNPIAQAAEKTQGQPGSRSTIVATISTPIPPGSGTFRGRGEYNGETGRSRVTLTVELPEPIGTVRMHAVGDGRLVYMRSPALEGSLPPGKQWMAIDPWLGDSDGGTALPGNGDTQGQLELLADGSVDVEELGEEAVRGVPTSRYRCTIDLDAYVAVLREEGAEAVARQFAELAEETHSPVTAEAWVDEGGLLRRMRMVMPLAGQDSETPATMDMRIEFFDFGITPDIALPSSSEVFDTTPLVRAELERADGK